MLLYLSTNKIDNLFEEIGFKKKTHFNSFSHVKFSLKVIEAQFQASKDSLEYRLQKIVKSLKKSGKLKTINEYEYNFSEMNFYECCGRMHLHKVKDNSTGSLIGYDDYNAPNKVIDFDVDIKNRYFNKLIISCSLYNLRFLDFTDPERHPPNSMGTHLISSQKSTFVEMIFVLTNIDSEQKTLYGSPLIITC